MRKWLYAWAVMAAAVALTAWVFPGIHVRWSLGDYFLIAAVLALVNLSLGTIMRLLSIPIRLITLGLFSLVINMVLFMVTAWFMDSLSIDNIGAAFFGSLFLSIVRSVLGYVVDRLR